MLRVTTQRRWIWTYRCAMWSTVVVVARSRGRRRVEIWPDRTRIAANQFTQAISALFGLTEGGAK